MHRTWALVLFMLFSTPLYADNRASGVDGMEEAFELMDMIRDARYQLMTLWINCKLDKLCVCDNKQALYEKTDNFALKVMIEQQRKNEELRCDRMREDYHLCQIPMIEKVHEAILPCYYRVRDGLFLEDKRLYEEGVMCLAEQLQPLVDADNYYATYVFVDFLSSHPEKYPGFLNVFEKKLDSLKGSEGHKEFLQCQDFLNLDGE